MPGWNRSRELPGQLADVFAALHDWFDDGDYHTEAVNYSWDLDERRDADATRLDECLLKSGWATPPEVREYLAAAGTDLPYRAYVVLRCIDRWVGRHHPRLAGGEDDPDALYDRHGRYNTAETEGYVLPKWVKGMRGTFLDNQFKHLVRARVERDQVLLIGREGGTRHAEPPPNLTFAIVPFLYDLSDATFRGQEQENQHYFDVFHSEETLRQRVRDAVRAIRAAGVHVAIFPELVLTEAMVEILGEELHASELELTSEPPLKWVIAGSYSRAESPKFPLYNSAFVLESGGAVVAFSSPAGTQHRWVQSKRHRYMLSKGEQERYQVVDCFEGDPYDRPEAISISHRRTFVFDSKHGRYAILICEDWAQEVDTCEVLRKLNCSAIFVIVMDGPVSDRRWSAQRVGFFQPHTGADIAVANSLLLPLRVPPRTLFGGYVLIPQANGADPLISEWKYEEEIGDRTNVGLLMLADEPKAHYVNAATQPSGANASLISNTRVLGVETDRADLGS